MAQSKKNKVKRVSFSFLEISKTHLPNCRRRGANTCSEYGHLHLATCKNYISEKEMEKQEFHIRAEFIESNGAFSSDPAQFYTSPPTQFEIPPLPTSLNTVPGVMNKKSSTTDSLPFHEKNSPGRQDQRPGCSWWTVDNRGRLERVTEGSERQDQRDTEITDSERECQGFKDGSENQVESLGKGKERRKKQNSGLERTPANSVFNKPVPELSFPQTALDLRNEAVPPHHPEEETPSTSSTETPPHELALHTDNEQPTSSVFSGDLDDDIMALLDDSESEGEDEDDSSTKESSASSEDECVIESDIRNIAIEVVSPDSSPVKSLPPSNPILLGPIVKTRTSFSDSGYGEGEEEEGEEAPIITLSSRRRGAKKVKTWFENSAATTTPDTTETTQEPTTTEQPVVVGFVNPFTRTPVTTSTVVKEAPSVLGGLVTRSVVTTEPQLTLPRHDPSVQEQYFKFDTPSRDDMSEPITRLSGNKVACLSVIVPIRFRLVLDQFSITFYEKVLKIAIFRQAVLSPLYAILGVTSPPVSADTRPLPKLDFSAILARTIKPRPREKNPFFSLMAQSKKNKVKRVSFSFLEISKTHLPNCRRRGANTCSEYGHLHLATCKNYISEKEMEKQEFHIRAEFIESNGAFSSDPAQFYTSPPTQFEIPPLPTSLNTVPGVMNKKSSTTDSLPFHEKNSPGRQDQRPGCSWWTVDGRLERVTEGHDSEGQDQRQERDTEITDSEREGQGFKDGSENQVESQGRGKEKRRKQNSGIVIVVGTRKQSKIGGMLLSLFLSLSLSLSLSLTLTLTLSLSLVTITLSPGLERTPANSVFTKPVPELSFPQTALDLRNEAVPPHHPEETPSTSSTETPPHELALHTDNEQQPTSSVFSGDLDDDIMALLDDSESEGEDEDDSSTKESSASSEDDCVIESDIRNIAIEVVSPDSTPVKSLPPSNPILLGPIVKTRTSFSDSGYGEGEEEEEEAPIITLSSRRRGAKKVKTWFENSAATTTPDTTETTQEPTTTEQPVVVGFVNPFTRTPVTTSTVVKEAPSVLGGLVTRSVVATEPQLTLPRHDPSVQEQYFKFDTPSRDDLLQLVVYSSHTPERQYGGCSSYQSCNTIDRLEIDALESYSFLIDFCYARYQK
eukprot:sb/3461332/